jgi:Cytochrome c554 and c-prime
MKRAILTRTLLPPTILALAALASVGCSSSDTNAPVGANTGTTGGNTSSTGTGTPPPPNNSGNPIPNFAASETCEKCHTAAYDEWKHSMHAHAVTSPTLIAQTNQAYQQEYANEDDQDFKSACNNCHSPISTALTKQGNLPFSSPEVDDKYINEGVSCVTCHSYNDFNPAVGKGVLTDFGAELDRSGVMYGPFADAVDNRGHNNAKGSLFADEDAAFTLCSSCHNVVIDANRNGILEVDGGDLVLQNTSAEFENYEAQGGDETCISCHMPVKRGVSNAAEGDDSVSAPPREVHKHSFVGVDYPLDDEAAIDAHRSEREALLRTAADIEIQNVNLANGNLTFDVAISNNDSGHNFPTGFAFARQSWLEITVLGDNDQQLFESGFLRRNTDDLCDATTINGNLGRFVRGCQDGQEDDLVNLQLQLSDRNNQETTIQFIDGKVLNRARPVDGTILRPIEPNETLTFGYAAQVGNGNVNLQVRARLLFRNLPPYMVRAWAEAQGGNEKPLEVLVENLEIVEVDETSVQVN